MTKTFEVNFTKWLTDEDYNEKLRKQTEDAAAKLGEDAAKKMESAILDRLVNRK